MKIGTLLIEGCNQPVPVTHVVFDRGEIHLWGTTEQVGTWSLPEGRTKFSLWGVDGALIEEGECWLNEPTITKVGHLTVHLPLRITEMAMVKP